jgi:hypothetical protein
VTSAPILTSRVLASQVLGAAGSTSSRPARRSRSTYALGNPGRPAEDPTLLIAVFDNSGSVVSPGGTDPRSNRYAEVDRAFSIVARKGAEHELGAVLHFDTPTSSDVDPTPITKQGLARLRAGLRIPPDGAGSSRLAPSLRRAVKLAQAHPAHLCTLVVLSDFQLLDPDAGAVLADLNSYPGQVHAVVLGGQPGKGAVYPRIAATYIGRDDPPGAVARALFTSLTTHRPGSRAYEAAYPDHRSP